MKNTEFDVIIIGGGPAGAVAAIYLSRSGLNTAIIERKTFPRETLCGEFLSLEVIAQLKSLGLQQKFLDQKPNTINTFRFISAHQVFDSKLPFPGYSLKRSVLDEFLVTEALNSGTHLFQPAEAKNVEKKNDRFIVRINSEHGTRELSSKFVLGAYGKNNLQDKKFRRKQSGKFTGYYGIKFHFSKNDLVGINDSCIYLFRGNNIYAGVNSVNEEEVTVCFLARKYSREITPSDQLAKLFGENTHLSEMFDNRVPDLKSLKVYGAGNIYFGREEPVKNGVIMIGDAAKIIAPLAGDGIGMAFQSAKIASEVIKEAFEREMNSGEIEQVYSTKWKQQFSRRTTAAGLVQSIILRNLYMNLIPTSLIKYFIPVLIDATRN